MNDGMKINVQLTLRDIKDFIISKHRKARGLAFSMFILFVVIWPATAIIIASPDWPLYLLTGIVVAVIASLPILFPFLTAYRANINDFKSSNLLQQFNQYEFDETGVIIHSADGTGVFRWVFIDKIVEYKKCFLIYSQQKIMIIPRRCFNSEQQLVAFRFIVKKYLKNKKLRLRKYKLGDSKPDYNATEDAHAIEVPAETENTCLFEIIVLLTQNDIHKLNFWKYYMQPTGILLTIAGIAALIIFIIQPVQTGNIISTWLIIGISLTVLMPILLYVFSIRSYRNQRLNDRRSTYKFHNDFFTVSTSDGTQMARWDDLYKITVTKSLYILFATTRLGYIIPKRDLDADQIRFFEAHLKKTNRR